MAGSKIVKRLSRLYGLLLRRMWTQSPRLGVVPRGSSTPAAKMCLGVGLLALSLSAACRAGPDPVVIVGNLGTAEGNQSAGVLSGIHFSIPPVTKLTVGNLTTEIEPAAGTVGVRMRFTASNGSNGIGFPGGGFNGDAGGAGTALSLDVNSGLYGISTAGNGAYGLEVQSLGGRGGNGGWAFGVPIPPLFVITSPAFGGDGARGGAGGALAVNHSGQISTIGDNASAIYLRSKAGDGGTGGWAFSTTYAKGGDGGVGGSGGTVALVNTGRLITLGEASAGILAQSFGAQGGDGGEGDGLFGSGGAGLGSGSGGAVTVTNTGWITTEGLGAKGVMAMSVGGFAGAGGEGGGLFAWGGSGASSGHGGPVWVTNTGRISTIGSHADAVFAQSIGGGGGSGGGAGGLFTYGGSGQAGGDGGEVTVDLDQAQIHTSGGDARGLFAQSVGGGGGSGGGAVSASTFFSAALGGSAGPGGDGKLVTVDTGLGLSILTEGERAHGLHAQSLGGGGGTGGYAVAVSGGLGLSVSIGIGGTGGEGGDGGDVVVRNHGSIMTEGQMSHALYVQSTGGGGGSGGFAFSGAGSDVFAGSFSLGGKAGGGGSAGLVDVVTTGVLQTYGDESVGVLAESVGGGGGRGGWAISGAGAGTGAVTLSIGGSGGLGGHSDAVTVFSQSEITTHGYRSYGIHAQSTGGGGGAGGFSISGAGAGGGAVTFNLGGSAGGGGDGDAVTVTNLGRIITMGREAVGLFAESTGGGGGSGGFSITGAGAGWGALSIGIGGKGGLGGDGKQVTVVNTGEITTLGLSSHAIYALSTGGGGGVGGFSIAGSGAGSYSGTFSLGGLGGGGGDGQNVEVTSSGNIFTGGASAVGIFAESVGGGGGNGGWSLAGAGAGTGALTIGIGGKSGDGGDGGTVTVQSTSSITTLGHESLGIHAHSTGGGGGVGGFSLAGSGAGSYSGTFSLGGMGGDGGIGEEIWVESGGMISTGGDLSTGILALSVGGGGGKGGWSISGTGAGTSALTLGIGGFGGGGGDAGAVTVIATAPVYTSGREAHAIHAHSTGGGGGIGRFSISGAGGGDYSGTFNLGGSGGDGGDGQNVVVGSSAWLEVGGPSAKGIVAESVGGGGGSGGWSLSGAGAGSGALTIGIGGSGGDGGSGGNVTVNNLGGIATHGVGGIGIDARSTGGGGGSGGFSISGDGAGTAGKVWALSVGGSGGDGSVGGQVEVNNLRPISTAGEGAHGLVAKSQGGGGGGGGFSASLGTGFGGAKDTWNLNLTTAIGGDGGKGNAGGEVLVVSRDSITTLGDDAFGIYAQSVGGGGGDGGSSFTATIGLGAANEGRSFNGSLSIGGGGGEGNVGNTVTVDSMGQIFTGGDMSDAIRAQSIGGGGGSGGSSRGISLLLKAGSAKLEKDQSPGANWQFSFNIGGNAGKGDHGGEVRVDHIGDIQTLGTLSRGIVAQSVGGGGGSGGDGIRGTGTAADFATLALLPVSEAGGSGNAITKRLMGQLRDVSLSVGGNAGGSGDGHNVHVGHTGSIITQGMGSTAIFAQSIGGGGGEAQSFTEGKDAGGKAVSGMMGKFAIGGAGGAAGSGGTVVVEQTGQLITFGDEAHGIFAQSVGGGGGVAGTVDRALVDGIGPIRNIGLGIGFGRDGGGAGDGGAVTVESIGDIITHGNEAYGIKAQSVGGGGGSGVGTSFLADSPLTRFDGSVGGDGSGGEVDVHHLGNITTTGAMADGIFAQSAGGADHGGGVTIVLDGSVVASGRGSHGILANSRGDEGAGDIRITAAGAVIGGTGEGAAGIRILDGRDNAITSSGLITTMDGVDGLAIQAGDGNDTVNNSGTIRGSVNLGGGINRFNNLPGALFESGAVVALGANHALYNDGILSPGGIGATQTTRLGSDFVQSAQGIYHAELDLKSDDADRLIVDGSATLQGTIRSTFLSGGYAHSGRRQITVLEAAEGITNHGTKLVMPSSAIVTGRIVQPNEQIVAVDLQVDYTPSGITGNNRRMGNYIRDLQNTGGCSTFAPIAETLLRIPDVPSLAAAYERLCPASVNESVSFTSTSAMTFFNVVHSVPTREGDHRFISEQDGFWVRFKAERTDRERTSEFAGSYHTVYMPMVGVQRRLDENGNWIGGIALSVEHHRTQVESLAESSGEIIRLGGVIKHQMGPTEIALSFGVGHGWFESKRFVGIPSPTTTAVGKWGLTNLSGNLRLSHDLEWDNFYIRPMIDLGINYVHRESFTETGAGGANLAVSSANDLSFAVNPAIQFGMEHRFNNDTLLRLRTRVGASYIWHESTPQTQASFVGAPAGLPPVTVLGEREELFGTVSAGIELIDLKGASLQLEYTARFSGRAESHGVGLKVAIPF